MKFIGNIFVLIVILFLLSQFPEILKISIMLVQVVGGYTLNIIEHHPIFFCVGVVVIYGLMKTRK